jgi:phage gpG-like protein
VAGKATIEAGQWTSFLNGVSKNIKDPIGLLKAAFMTAGFADIINHFKNESGPTGRWKPRSATTQAQYALRARTDSRYSPSNKLLQLTGNLRKSILPNNTKRVGTAAIQIFANAEYSGKHDMGTDNMPQREFMWFSNEAKERMAQVIASLAFK